MVAMYDGPDDLADPGDLVDGLLAECDLDALLISGPFGSGRIGITIVGQTGKFSGGRAREMTYQIGLSKNPRKR